MNTRWEVGGGYYSVTVLVRATQDLYPYPIRLSSTAFWKHVTAYPVQEQLFIIFTNFAGAVDPSLKEHFLKGKGTR